MLRNDPGAQPIMIDLRFDDGFFVCDPGCLSHRPILQRTASECLRRTHLALCVLKQFAENDEDPPEPVVRDLCENRILPPVWRSLISEDVTKAQTTKRERRMIRRNVLRTLKLSNGWSHAKNLESRERKKCPKSPSETITSQ